MFRPRHYKALYKRCPGNSVFQQIRPEDPNRCDPAAGTNVAEAADSDRVILTVFPGQPLKLKAKVALPFSVGCGCQERTQTQ